MENPEILEELRRVRALLQTLLVIQSEIAARQTGEDPQESIEWYRLKYRSFLEKEID